MNQSTGDGASGLGVAVWWRGLERERRRVMVLTALAFAMVAASGVLVAKLVDDVFGGDDVTQVDPKITDYLVRHRTPWVTTLARTVTHLGDATVVAPVVATAVVVLLRLARRRLAGFVALSAVGAAAATSFGKFVVDRPRPPSADWLTAASGAAFPSGHATQGIACWCALAVAAAMLTRRRVLQGIVLGLGAVLAVGIGASRVYLGVHWSSDVVCGWAVATAWLLTLVLMGWSRPQFADEIETTRRHAGVLTGTLFQRLRGRAGR